MHIYMSIIIIMKSYISYESIKKIIRVYMRRLILMSMRNPEKRQASLFFMLAVLLALYAGIPTALGANIDTCTTISKPGIYTLTGNILDSNSPNCIYIKANDVVFNGNGYVIDGIDALYSNGVYVNKFLRTLNNVTVKNVTLKDWNKGIYYKNADNGKLENNNVISSIQGIYLESSGNNNLKGNSVNSDGAGITLISSSDSNVLVNNTIITSGGYGLHIESSGSNKITGGSIIAGNSYDYYLGNAGSTNYFKNTNFTGARKIFFFDTSSYFNYSNETGGSSWIRTRISGAGYLNRTLLNWNMSLMKFRDTNGSGNIVANYTLSGLLTNSTYKIYNTSQGKETNSYTIKSDSHGNLGSFTIMLKGDTEIRVQVYNNSKGSNLIISDITVADAGRNAAVISWQTGKLSDSLVKYGKYSLNYTLQGYNSSLTTNHSMKLSGLSSATTYYFVVNSTDQSGNSNESREMTFTTPGAFNNQSVAVVYERVADKMQNDIERNITNETELLSSIRTDIIFRGWWHERMTMDNCTQLSIPSQRRQCDASSMTYEYLINSTSAIKEKLPGSIFIGAVPAQQLYNLTYDPGTHQFVQYPDTWNMALDPAKLGIAGITKEQFQCDYARNRTWLNETFDCAQYNPANATAYFPDITNESFRSLLLNLSEKQIDSGADGIWFDGLLWQAKYMAAIAGDVNHTSVNASYSASLKIIESVHNYKQGVYAGSWADGMKLPYPPLGIDFTTVTPSRKEVMNQTFDEISWNWTISSVREKMGDIPIIAFIDWSDTSETPLGAFSQNMSKENQSSFLRVADAFFQKKGVIFAYPMHGGFLGKDAQVLSFGTYPFYDALAPESDTYGTIRDLSLAKAGYV